MTQASAQRTGISPTVFLAATMTLVTLGRAVDARADDWPGFLGPSRDGISAETGLLPDWPEGGPEVLWKVSLGDGYSSVAVSEGRVLTIFAESGGEWVGAFDAASGEALWRTRIGRDRRDGQGRGPRSTPTVVGGRAFVLGALANLRALDVATGEVLWSHDLEDEYGADVPTWGVSASPLVEDGRVVVPAGGGKDRAFLAFDAASGELVWSSGRAQPSYGSPIAVTLGDVRQAIFFMADGLHGVALEDGRELWTAPWTTRYDVNAATPLFVPSSGLFVSSGYGTGAALLQVVTEGDGLRAYQIWRNRLMRNTWSTSVRVGQYLYGFDESILKCLDVLSGEELWRGRANGEGTLLFADGHLLVLGGQGQLRLVEATPDEFRTVAEARISTERTWAAPALADGVLYVRSWSELIALRVGRSPATPTDEPAPAP